MGGGLVIIEPTQVLRDWLRTALDLPEVWAGGPPKNGAVPDVVITRISSSLNGPSDRASWQFDCTDEKASTAATLASRLATLLVRTPPRTLIGSTPAGTVLFMGAIESSVSIFPDESGEQDEDLHRYVVLIDLLTIAVPTPTP